MRISSVTHPTELPQWASLWCGVFQATANKTNLLCRSMISDQHHFLTQRREQTELYSNAKLKLRIPTWFCVCTVVCLMDFCREKNPIKAMLRSCSVSAKLNFSLVCARLHLFPISYLMMAIGIVASVSLLKGRDACCCFVWLFRFLHPPVLMICLSFNSVKRLWTYALAHGSKDIGQTENL